jgi:hypothetical protein
MMKLKSRIRSNSICQSPVYRIKRNLCMIKELSRFILS